MHLGYVHMKMKKPAVEAELLQRVSFCLRRGREMYHPPFISLYHRCLSNPVNR